MQARAKYDEAKKEKLKLEREKQLIAELDEKLKEKDEEGGQKETDFEKAQQEKLKLESLKQSAEELEEKLKENEEEEERKKQAEFEKAIQEKLELERLKQLTAQLEEILKEKEEEGQEKTELDKTELGEASPEILVTEEAATKMIENEENNQKFVEPMPQTQILVA
ncbi:hypothetical protein RF11_03904 [Thelohanellus kitauei]|uniref:Uncharacterized protein n=1 Tax=Thelohanellus kitauei TaxID=669202 RepID=A0A0C2MBV9_THEKT|nr:hypothetical protein RF11_03904 [Thelohanellus kitauei]